MHVVVMVKYALNKSSCVFKLLVQLQMFTGRQYKNGGRKEESLLNLLYLLALFERVSTKKSAPLAIKYDRVGQPVRHTTYG